MKEDHKTSRLVLSGLLSLSLATASFPAVAFGEQTGVAETSAATAPAASSTTEGASAPSASASTEGGVRNGNFPECGNGVYGHPRGLHGFRNTDGHIYDTCCSCSSGSYDACRSFSACGNRALR